MKVEAALAYAADAMVAAAALGRSVTRVLKRLCPHVYRQIEQDRRCPDFLSLWGRSLNVDENAGQVIVHPAILSAIGELAGVPMRGPVVHAGLQHTYGYLFSTIQTPFGAKRDRWLSTAVERGVGMDPTLLSERPSAGTLLANVTWFAGRIAFRDRPASLRRLQKGSGAVAPALVAGIRQWPVSRIVEEVNLPRGTPVTLLTDLVPFSQRARGTSDEAILVYSVRIGTRAAPRLVTIFPVGPAMVRELLDSVPKRGTAAIRPRFNAHVPGWPGGTLPGRRYCLAGS